MTKIAVIHYPGATAHSYSVVASLVADLQDQRHEVTVIDIGNFTTTRQGYPPGWIARLLGHRVFAGRFQRELQEMGAAYLVANTAKGLLPLTDQQREDINLAVESELLTYFRTDRLHERQSYSDRLRKQLARQAIETGVSLHALFADLRFQEVIVPNGRTSRQKAARIAAEILKIPIRFYENGRALPNHYYLGSTQPHDRLASQAEVAKLTQNISSQEIETAASTFMGHRMSQDRGTNQFSTSWTTTTSQSTQSARQEKLAVFFPSSFDEYLAFGPMWNIDSWDYQFQAFDLVMDHLERQGFSLEMRLHPNLSNKSRRYFNREVANVSKLIAHHPKLLVHWHNSSTNSYDLVSRAALIFVERSTIGLEASMMGKPVWVNQACQWDLIADVRQVLSSKDISARALKPWVVNAEPAQRFAAYWMMQEHPLRFSWANWASWNPDNPPLRMRVALLAVPNSWRHRLHLIRVEWERLGNKSFAPSSVALTEEVR